MKALPYIFLYILLLGGCREPFEPGSKGHESALVVDGLITDQPGPYKILLAQTARLDSPRFIPYTNCRVILEESTGQQEVLEETVPGVYQTSQGRIEGTPGNAYRIRIETPEGNNYRSDFIEMKEPVHIDTLYAKLKRISTNQHPNGLPGYQFYLDTKTAADPNSYFYWRLRETWEYTSNFKIEAIYEGRGIDPNFPRDSLYRCWNTQPIQQIFTDHTSDLFEPRLSGHPLHFVGTDTKRLMERYSLLVKQFTIDQQAWQFWKDVKKQISEANFLFQEQPYLIGGNVYNPNDQDDVVRGYFMVASLDSQRIFVDKPHAEFSYPTCSLDTNLRFIHLTPPSELPVYLSVIDSKYGKAADECFDCRLLGGKLEPPDFWKE